METITPTGNQSVRHIIGKLSKFYPTFVLISIWFPGGAYDFFRKCPSPYKVLGPYCIFEYEGQSVSYLTYQSVPFVWPNFRRASLQKRPIWLVCKKDLSMHPANNPLPPYTLKINKISHTATHCYILQHTATHHITPQHTVPLRCVAQHVPMLCSNKRHASIICSLTYTRTHSLPYNSLKKWRRTYRCRALRQDSSRSFAHSHIHAHTHSHTKPLRSGTAHTDAAPQNKTRLDHLLSLTHTRTHPLSHSLSHNTTKICGTAHAHNDEEAP